MNLILNVVRSLQVIVHFPALVVILPSNLIIFFEILVKLVMFDIFEDLHLFDYIFDERYDEDELNKLGLSQLSNIGYQSFNLFVNLGSISFFCLLYLVKLVFTIFIIKPLSCLSKRAKKLFLKLYKQVFFKDILIIFFEGCMEFYISCFLQLQAPLEEIGEVSIYKSIAIALLTISAIILPLTFVLMVQQKQSYLESKDFMKKWEYFFETVNLKSQIGKFHPFFIIMQRLLFGVITFYARKYSFLQV